MIPSDRERGFGRYNIMIEPKNPKEDEVSLKDTLWEALRQIEEKQY